MNVTIKVEGAEYVAQWLEKLKPNVDAAVEQAMHRVTIALQAYIQGEKLSGNPLHQRSGKLKGSINQRVERTENMIAGIVTGAGGPAWYGQLHEWGGVFNVPTHMSVSHLGKSFQVRQHTIHFPERSFMRAGFEETKDQFVAWIQKAVHDGLEQK